VGGLDLLLLSLATALLFFALIPGAGAFTVRRQWRVFRRRMREASLTSFLSYADLSGEAGPRGEFRAFGELEAIQGRDRIWINTGEFTVEAELGGVTLYLLPSVTAAPPEREALPDEEPAVAPWSRVFSLPSGLRLFVSGSLFLEDGRGVFRSGPRTPLLVVFYDGERESILKRAIWGGRKKNEYWNPFTVPSLLTGFLCLALLSYMSLRTPQSGLLGLLALTLATAPVSPFLPPGVVLYYLYRYFWKTARRLRAERDLLLLPLRYFPEGRGVPRMAWVGARAAAGQDGERAVMLPTGERYLMTRGAGGLRVEGEPELRRGGRAADGEESWLFGAVEERRGRRVLKRPADPMAELLRVPGHPAVLARGCDWSARWYELAAGACFAVGAGVNLFAVFLLLAKLLR
jgi:hypothetical protein